ncbi:hypothetical protein C8R44DRAFT_733236 [Mycena epipterygia]|nr:hypothetical protein C8R44DRAFT_733236 [Mycena epipterygia]
MEGGAEGRKHRREERRRRGWSMQDARYPRRWRHGGREHDGAHGGKIEMRLSCERPGCTTRNAGAGEGLAGFRRRDAQGLDCTLRAGETGPEVLPRRHENTARLSIVRDRAGEGHRAAGGTKRSGQAHAEQSVSSRVDGGSQLTLRMYRIAGCNRVTGRELRKGAPEGGRALDGANAQLHDIRRWDHHDDIYRCGFLERAAQCAGCGHEKQAGKMMKPSMSGGRDLVLSTGSIRIDLDPALIPMDHFNQ